MALVQVEQRRNLAVDPAATGHTLTSGQAGWLTTRWFGNSPGAGTYTFITAASDGPVGLRTYLRKAWTTGSSGIGQTGFNHDSAHDLGTPQTGGLAVTPGNTMTFSSYVRSSAAGKFAAIQAYWRDASGNQLSSSVMGPVQLTPGAWTRLSVTAVVPAGAATVGLTSDITGGTNWAAGDKLDGTGLLLENNAGLGSYFDGATPNVGNTTTLGSVLHNWLGATNGSASTLTVVQSTVTFTVTLQPSTVPPSVRIDVTDSNGTPETSATVQRIDLDGQTRPVRTSDGGPLILSGGAGTVIDYECPYGAPITYQVVGAASTVQTALPADQVWLVDPGVPAQSMPLVIATMGDRARAAGSSRLTVLRRKYPVAISSGIRSAPTGQMIVRTVSEGDMNALGQLLDNSTVLLLNVPADLGYGFRTAYLDIGDTTEARLVNFGREQRRHWTLPYQQVDRPGGGNRAAITWATIAAEYATWADIPKGTTWAALANPAN